MFSPSRRCALRHRYVSTSLIFACILWATGLPVLTRALALQISDFSDTLSTSKPGVGANHTILFTTPSGVPADGSTIDVDLPVGFDVSLITEDDVDIADDGVELTTGAVCGAVQASVSVSLQTVSIAVCSGGGGAIAPGSVVRIKIGDHAVESGIGAEQIVNSPALGYHEIGVGGTMEDAGYTGVVIMESVTASGEVETYFGFSVGGVVFGESVNGDLTLTTGTTTATSVPFGLVNYGNEYVLAQDLFVTTNSGGGFTVTVEASGDLASTIGSTIDPFADGGADAVPAPWAAPSAIVGNADTYGHWGITTEDTSLSDGDPFDTARYAGNFIGTPREIMYATSSADGTTAHIGATRVGYKLETSAMQEASREYRTDVRYVATPIF